MICSLDETLGCGEWSPGNLGKRGLEICWAGRYYCLTCEQCFPLVKTIPSEEKTPEKKKELKGWRLS